MDGGPRRRARSHGRVTCTAAPSGPSPERPRSGYDTEIREQLPRSGLVQYSMMERSPEHNGVLQTCEELSIGFVPWGPVGMGYLTGKLNADTKFDPKTDLRSGFTRFSPENLAANLPIVEFIKAFGEKKGATPSQIAL